MQKRFDMKGQETIGEVLEFIQTSLKGFKLSSKETMRAELMSEEVLVRLIEHSDFSERNYISVSINKFLGNISIDMQVPGDEFEFMVGPDLESGINDESSAEAIQSIILRSLGDKISYRHSRHFNSVRLNVFRSQYFNLYLILTAMILAIPIRIFPEKELVSPSQVAAASRMVASSTSCPYLS